MSQHLRIVGCLWIIAGIALFAWALWELAVTTWTLSILPWSLIFLAYGFCGAVGGLFLYNGEKFGRYLISIAAVVGLMYALLLMLMDGFDIALSNQPGAIMFALFCGYSIAVAVRGKIRAA